MIVHYGNDDAFNRMTHIIKQYPFLSTSISYNCMDEDLQCVDLPDARKASDGLCSKHTGSRF